MNSISKQYGHLAGALTAEARRSIPAEEFAAVWTDAQGHQQRKLPIHNAAHVRNALARFDQTDLPASIRSSAKAKITSAAKRFGIK